MKRWILILFIFMLNLQANAFEDYIITTKGRLTDIRVEDNMVVDVYPLITIMNDKNTLIVSPLKEGKTKFSVLKNNKERYEFSINIEKDKTTIDKVKGFEILSIDMPVSDEFQLDEPPKLKENKRNKVNG